MPYVERIVKGLVNPLLHSVKPSFFSTLSIEEFNLGRRSPYIKSLRWCAARARPGTAARSGGRPIDRLTTDDGDRAATATTATART